MKNLILLLTSILFFSCESTTKKEHESVQSFTQDTSSRNESGISYSNPVLIEGSDFGRFFQAMYKIGDFNKMLNFTSNESISQHGRDKIVDLYKNMNFGYKIRLKSKNENPDGSITLNYSSEKMATKNITRIDVVVENDSCKIVLPKNLKDFKL